MQLNKNYKILIGFIASYAVLFALQALKWTGSWGNTPTYYLLPIPGFFLMYYLSGWIGEYFEAKFHKHPAFAALIVILLVLGFYIALTFFYHNNFTLSGQSYVDAFSPAMEKTNSVFWNELKESTFLMFALSVLFGWITYYFIERKKTNA